MIFDSCSRVYRVSLCDDFPWLVVGFVGPLGFEECFCGFGSLSSSVQYGLYCSGGF